MTPFFRVMETPGTFTCPKRIDLLSFGFPLLVSLFSHGSRSLINFQVLRGKGEATQVVRNGLVYLRKGLVLRFRYAMTCWY